MQKCFENGLYNKVLEWTINFNNKRFQAYQATPNGGEIVLKMEIVFSVFVMYLAGMLVSFGVFLMEILLRLWKRRQHK